MTDQIETVADVRSKGWALEREKDFKYLIEEIGFNEAMKLSNEIGHANLGELIIKQRLQLKADGKISESDPYPKGALNIKELEAAADEARNKKAELPEPQESAPVVYTHEQNEELFTHYLTEAKGLTTLDAIRAHSGDRYEKLLEETCDALRKGSANDRTMSALGLSKWEKYQFDLLAKKELAAQNAEAEHLPTVVSDDRAEKMLKLADQTPGYASLGGASSDGKVLSMGREIV